MLVDLLDGTMIEDAVVLHLSKLHDLRMRALSDRLIAALTHALAATGLLIEPARGAGILLGGSGALRGVGI